MTCKKITRQLNWVLIAAWETFFQEHHPEIFSSPFVTIKLRARARVKIWAVLKIQRLWRRALFNKRKRDEMAKQVIFV